MMSLLRLTATDRVVRYTAIALATGILMSVLLYGATAGEPNGSVLAMIHQEIGLSKDGSLAEVFSYGMAFLASVLFFASFVETRSRALLFLSMVMAFIWIDDSAQYHERFGGWLAVHFELDALAGLRPQDTGEILAWMIAGLILLLPLGFALLNLRAGDPGILATAGVGFAMLGLCGGVVDLLHVAVQGVSNTLFEIIEDGGEMVAVAYLSVLALSLTRNAVSYCRSTRLDMDAAAEKFAPLSRI